MALAGCGDGSDTGDQRADQIRAAAADAGLGPEVADFLALAARGQTATYQATYPGPNANTKLVVANDPPDRRVDVLTDDVTTEVRLVLDGEAFTCPRDQDKGTIVSCRRTDAIVEGPGAFDDATLEQLTSTLRDRRADYTFRIDTRPIAGVQARCLVTELKQGHDRSDLGCRRHDLRLARGRAAPGRPGQGFAPGARLHDRDPRPHLRPTRPGPLDHHHQRHDGSVIGDQPTRVTSPDHRPRPTTTVGTLNL